MSYATSGKATTRKNLFGWIGRIWQGLWVVCGIAVVAYVTSSVTSVMTTLSLTNHINSVADLPGKTVGVLSGSIGEEFAIGENLTIRTYNSTADMAHALERNEIDAVIDDAPVLEYYVYTHPGEALDVVGPLFHPDKYGFGLPHGAELRRALNVQILGDKESGFISEIYERYFGDDPT